MHTKTTSKDEDKEASAPCGGFTADFSKDNLTDFHVDGDAISGTLLNVSNQSPAIEYYV